MGKVYQCDRCGAIGKIGAVGDESFAGLKYGLVGCTLNHEVLLCPHCTKKLEEFLSDPNCMEETENKDRYCLNCNYRDNHYYKEPCINCHDHENWEPNKKEEVHHCGTCEYQFENGICPRTYTCSNDSIACKNWKLKEVGK